MSSQVFKPTPVNEFSLGLYHSVSSHTIGESSVVSPFSVFLTLLMCLFGAGDKTATQLANTLKIHHFSNESVYSGAERVAGQLSQLSLAPALWSQANRVYIAENFGINLDYVATLGNAFQTSKSPVTTTNFGEAKQVVEEINNWVGNITHGLIQDLLDQGDVTESTMVVLVNALYFKAEWAHTFEEENTEEADFHLETTSNTTARVQMMNSMEYFKYGNNPHNISADFVELPYESDTSAMTIILPHEGVKLAAVEKKLTAKILQEIISSDNFNTEGVSLSLPKFYIRQKQTLNSYLIDMGAKDAFDSKKANFTLMSDQTEFFLSKVIHEAVINVTESGTEAAAATAALMLTAMAPPRNPVEFKCNRPFMYVIHEKATSNILFMGKYVKPE